MIKINGIDQQKAFNNPIIFNWTAPFAETGIVLMIK
jgi:hypothetical protein